MYFSRRTNKDNVIMYLGIIFLLDIRLQLRGGRDLIGLSADYLYLNSDKGERGRAITICKPNQDSIIFSKW